MLTQSLSRAAIIAALCLANLAIAAIPSASTRTTESTSITTRRPNEKPSARPDDKVMAACGGHISECGVHDKAKIIYIPISTVTVTNEIITTSITTLPPQINYITEVKVETVNNKTQGHCRDTVTLDGDIVTVKVDINVVAVEEVIPISNVTVYTTTTVTANATEQCFLETNTLQPGPPKSRRPDERPTIPSLSPPVRTDAATGNDEHTEQSSSFRRTGLEGSGGYVGDGDSDP
ncbi:hypothetical protein BKA59DRAFT_475117 [Fusarium tricinctum]|uniref:Uncharacterized protein n=1 Tax=Fusarium tricinctum TaxID=61284 RepID=A0A8K0WEL4_9HYPO|nr:hypothetical protein BKA59DRAFT_475117 [Fusarium tricinctum]